MSYQYEYLDPSCYEESEQYETEQYEIDPRASVQQYEYTNNASFREEQHQEVTPERDTDMEVVEEQKTETESCNMRYHNADTLIQAEIKELIIKKETDKVKLVILNEQKADITQQIKVLQELRNKVVEENNFLTMNVEIEKVEFFNLQKRVAYNKEIVERLEQFIETIEKQFDQLNTRNSQQWLNITEQMEKVRNTQNAHRKNISQIKSDISRSRICRKDDSNPLKNENMVLKAKIIEKQTYLKTLKERCEQMDEKEKCVKQLIDEKECLEKDLENKNSELKELKDLIKKKEINLSECRSHIESSKEEKKKRIADALERKENIDAEILRISNEKEEQNKILLQKEEYNSQLGEQINKLVELYESRKLIREQQAAEHKSAIDSAEEKLRIANVDLAELDKETEELTYSLELTKQEYMTKIEEKSDALSSKLKYEEQLHLEEVLLTNIKLLDEQIIIKKKGPEELLQKIEALSADQSIEDLNKKKAYLMSSTDYLTEKQENLMKEAEKAKATVKDIHDSINHYKQLIKEHQERTDKLKEELKERTENRDAQEENWLTVEENQANITPTSILKSPLSHKKAPNSPKKVQFEGVPSFDSSSNSDGATISGSQQSIVGKTFDDILEEIKAESFKKPLKAPKKRKLDIE